MSLVALSGTHLSLKVALLHSRICSGGGGGSASFCRLPPIFKRLSHSPALPLREVQGPTHVGGQQTPTPNPGTGTATY